MSEHPKLLNDLIGQDNIKEVLRISIDSSNNTGKSVSHMLFQGPPGLGKSTLAQIVANEIGSKCECINGATIDNSKSLVRSLVKANDRDIVFIDEIHALPKKVFELLYMPLQENKLLIQRVDKKTCEENSVVIPLKNFTLIGATTNIGTIPKPLLDRIQLQFYLDFYSEEDIGLIIKRNLELQGNIHISKAGIRSLSQRCKGIPRIANGHLKWIRDFAGAKHLTELSTANIKEACDLYGIDENGFNYNDRAYLSALKNAGGPLGLKTISFIADIPEQAILEHIEPYLVRKKIVSKTRLGRILSLPMEIT